MDGEADSDLTARLIAIPRNQADRNPAPMSVCLLRSARTGAPVVLNSSIGDKARAPARCARE